MSATEIKDTANELKVKQVLFTLGGKFHYDWDETTPVTDNAYILFFAEFLKICGLMEGLVAGCPLVYKSNNAPKVIDILGTIILGILNGHSRYRHTDSIYGDAIAAESLGLNKIVSCDSLRRAFVKTPGDDITRWLDEQLLKCCEPLLKTDYILDLDPTVKPLYGEQEGAKVGYNPKKPGRPSHCFHTFCIAKARLILNVEVRPGNETAGKYSLDGLLKVLQDQLSSYNQPKLIRGDIGFGNDVFITECEEAKINYLFKLRQSGNVLKRIQALSMDQSLEWQDAGSGWYGIEEELQLMGWKNARHVIILRRLHEPNTVHDKQTLPVQHEQTELFPEISPKDSPVAEYEYAVLVTDLKEPILSIAQLYRDRGDCENIFDELKNQWGWGGFVTQDLKRTKLMAQITALIYNWWNVFCRLAQESKHLEGNTSRRLLQNVIGRMTNCGGKRMLHLTAPGANGAKCRRSLDHIAGFFKKVISTASQLNREYRWAMVLREAFKVFVGVDAITPGEINGQFMIPLAEP